MTTSVTSSSSSLKASTAINKQTKRKKENFELEENDNWPEVDLGNLIIDLDADIDKTVSSPSSNSSPTAAAGSSSNSSSNSSSTSATTTTSTSTTSSSSATLSGSRIKTITNINNSGSGGSSTAVMTETRLQESTPASESVSSGADKDKGLKMKIKRSKNRHNEAGKLEIVQERQRSGSASPRSESPVVNGASSEMVPLSAAEIVAATKEAVKKANGSSTGGKIRINSSSTSNSSKSDKPGKHKASKEGSKSGPPAKKQKVDASVGTEMGTMTEPDCLGPLDPGTSVTLEGIVWQETDGGVLVINVTWRGKTYVGTLLDSSKQFNQWAPPRYSDSPSSEMENSRTPKGRGKRGRGGAPLELETRKNLRSSKVKGRNNQAINSPAKRKCRSDRNEDDSDKASGDEKRRKRTDSSRNSPDDDDDSEKEQKDKENDDKDSASSVKGGKDDKDDDSDMMPKDEEEKRYIPPPPLPFELTCPKPDCKKKYRQHNGMKFHVSHSHPELLNANGDILEPAEIERMENEAKSQTIKEESSATDSSASAPSSKTSTPGPNDPDEAKKPKDQPTPPPPPPSAGYKPYPKPIRPPTNARPIVPATAPQIMPVGGQLGPMGLKPIQPRPTILPEPTPNLSLDELRKSKMKKQKKDSPGNSPPRQKTAEPPVKSPAYSDISDDGDEESKNKADKRADLNKPPFPYILPGATNVPGLPTANPKPPPERKEPPPPLGPPPRHPGLTGMQLQQQAELEKMLLSLNIPPPPGVDANLHFQLLTTDPTYRAKLEKEREKALKEKAAEDLRKTNSPAQPSIAVKPEFRAESSNRSDMVKTEQKDKKDVDEGVKPTMESRGPPPSNMPYGYMPNSLMRPPFGLPAGYEQLMGPLGAAYPPYGLPPHLAQLGMALPGARPPFVPPVSGSTPEDLSRSAAALAAVAGVANGATAAKTIDFLTQQFYPNHKIHELSESGKGDKAGASTTTSSSSASKVAADRLSSSPSVPPSGRKESPSPSRGANSKSPPPLRHVHTHTHTHYGLGYPLIGPPVPGLPPVPGAAPAAHSPLASPGFPNHMLPGKGSTLPNFPPPPK